MLEESSIHSGKIAGGILGTIAGLFILAMIALYIARKRGFAGATNESFFPLQEIRNNLNS